MAKAAFFAALLADSTSAERTETALGRWECVLAAATGGCEGALWVGGFTLPPLLGLAGFGLATVGAAVKAAGAAVLFVADTLAPDGERRTP